MIVFIALLGSRALVAAAACNVEFAADKRFYARFMAFLLETQ